MESRSPIRDSSGAALLGKGNDCVFPDGATVLDLFEDVVAAHPQRVAVRYRQVELTYEQINKIAETVATSLIAKKVTRGDLVPLLITDGPDFVAGLLALIKLGAAFVPVDPVWPQERLVVIFTSLSPKAILATPTTAEAVRDPAMAERIVLSGDNPPAARPTAVTVRPTADDLIYGYFTSGSTGVPKCALNIHRGLVNRLAAMSGHFGDGAAQVVLQNSRPTFDSSMWQILWPLTTGGQVVLPDRRGILDLEQTCRTIGQYGVTITDFVPSVLSALVTLLEVRPELRTELRTLRRMLVGGEAATVGVLQRLRQLLPTLRLTNTYGPTECSIGSVFHDIDDDRDPVPLGRPIQNTAALVLDDELRPVPPEVQGEIYIGGVCVGAGYLGDSRRTEQAFVPNPFAQIRGERLYRTGDLGQYSRDGLLMFGGRRDAQVKVGGVRVELGEIERALSRHPGVYDAAVVTCGEGDARALVGFITGGSPQEPLDVVQVRESLRQQLPAEMVPGRLLVLTEMPLTPNGKINRLALERTAARDVAEAAGPNETPPGSVEEELIASVWREVLEVDRVSVTRTFVAYGGTSLLAHRLGAILSVRLGRTIGAADLLTADTVRSQAAMLVDGRVSRARIDPGLLSRDAMLADLPGVRAPKAPPRSRRLLLTGATGFIGAHVLAGLLDHPELEVICLVRAADLLTARQRVAAVLLSYGLTEAHRQLPHRLATGQFRVLVGDLAEPGLGLSMRRFDRLANEIDGILHSGAMVNFLHDYADHRSPNVCGTQELLRLALSGAGCRIHALSTFSAFADAELNGELVGEDRLPDPQLLPMGGYSQSKHVMERLLENARQYRLDSVIYRLGEVWPHRLTGRSNPASLAHSVVYACARTGCFFPTMAVTDHLPVDLVSRYLVAAAAGPRPGADRVHVLRPVPLPFMEVFTRLGEVTGARLTGYGEFHRRLTAMAGRNGADEQLVRVAMLLPPPEGSGEQAPAGFDRMFTDSSRYFAVRTILEHAPTSAALLVGSPLDDLGAFFERLAAEKARE